MKGNANKINKGSRNTRPNRNSRNAKGGFNKQKQQNKYDSEIKPESSTNLSADNDPSWYAANPQLLKDYASFPFGYPLGGDYPTENTIYTRRVPGVMAFKFFPSVGVATNETSPINVAMRKLYSFVRYANSGSKNYDAPDLMLYVLAVDSAHMFLEHLKRAYGVMLNYTAFNRYYPRALITAMGFDYDDIEANLANFRGYINQFAVKLNQLWIPAGFSLMKRHQWLCQHIYVDSADSYKAQTYLFVPGGFYKFVLKGDPVVGALQIAPFQGMKTLTEVISLGNELLNPLITNEDIGIMAGDILKAYGAANTMQTFGIDENYRVLPEYSEEVMSAIENLTLAMPTSTAAFDVTQDTSIGGGFLISKPKLLQEFKKPNGSTLGTPPDNIIKNIADATFKPLAYSRMLNLHKANPEPEDVIVATRGMVLVDPATVKKSSVTGSNLLFAAEAEVACCGTELFVAAIMYYITDTGINYTSVQSADWTVIDSSDIDAATKSFSSLLSATAMAEQFDWHPIFDFCTLVGREQEYSWAYPKAPFVDSDTFTFIDRDNLTNMHSVALLSEFTVPMVQ